MFANENDCINDLKDKYVKLGHALFMSSPKFIYDYYKGILSLKKIEDYLSGIDSYTLHRLNKKPRRNYSYTYFWRERMEFDLIEIGKVANFNNGFKYILVRSILISFYLARSKSITFFKRLGLIHSADFHLQDY